MDARELILPSPINVLQLPLNFRYMDLLLCAHFKSLLKRYIAG